MTEAAGWERVERSEDIREGNAYGKAVRDLPGWGLGSGN